MNRTSGKREAIVAETLSQVTRSLNNAKHVGPLPDIETTEAGVDLKAPRRSST
jgi:hypothetical protein